MRLKNDWTKWLALAATLVFLTSASCGGGDPATGEPDMTDMVTITGMIERTMSISMGGDLGTAYANEPTETLDAESGDEYTLRRMPGCKVINEPPSDPRVITLGAQGPYEVKGIVVDGTFEAYEIRRLE